MENTFKELDLYTQDYAFRTLVQEVKEWVIGLNPIFQRNYKRDKDWYERCSKFIESCLMRIPLPSCYFRELADGWFDVIDWVQRITTIKDFINNKFALEGLSVIPSINGKKFSELEVIHQTDLRNYTMRCVILRRTNPEEIVYEIFARLNQWAVELSPQEIRKALYYGNMYQLLEELSLEPLIQKIVGKKNRDLQDQELILRFFAMSWDLDWYNDRLHAYLNDFMIKNQSIDRIEMQNYKTLFQTTLLKVKKLLWENPFSNHNNERKKSSIVIYDLIMRYCRNYNNTEVNIIEKLWEFYNDEDYKRSISWGIWQKSNIIRRRDLLLKYLHS